jgi:single-strand DNA-binding protein
MNNLNSILIEGNLVRDPLFRTTANGTALCTFSIASNRFYRQGRNLEHETSYFNVECWAKLAETCRDNGHKGRGVRIVGRIKQSRWTNAEGETKSRIYIVAEHLEFRPETRQGGNAALLEERAHRVDEAPSHQAERFQEEYR